MLRQISNYSTTPKQMTAFMMFVRRRDLSIFSPMWFVAMLRARMFAFQETAGKQTHEWRCSCDTTATTLIEVNFMHCLNQDEAICKPS